MVHLPESSPPLVVVVEDDAEIHRAVWGALAPAFTVKAVGPGPAAITLGASLLPDLVVVGATSALRVRMEPGLHDVPFLLVTDPAEAAIRADLLARAAQDYVVRPLSAAEIRARAANLVTTKRARDLLRQDLESDAADLEALARASSRRRQELATALGALRLAHERAARESRAKTAYLRTVGHELSAPLVSLREGLGHLPEDTPPAAARAIQAAMEWIAELGRATVEVARADDAAD